MVSKAEIVSETANGYLDKYRKEASFNVEKMKLFIETPQSLRIKKKVWSFFASDPLFYPQSIVNSSAEEKNLIAKQLVKFLHSDLFTKLNEMDFQTRTKYLMIVNEATEMVNPNLSIKFALGVSLFANALLSLGSKRHLKYYNDVWSGKILSCLAITELEHGSDTKRLRTTATYDKDTQQFVINTPAIGAAKCWIGNLGSHCTHALLFAQLVAEDICHGLHGFIVPVRDPATLIPYPRIVVGDIGEKAGLHGIDNGYILFDNYRIPRENLLNRIGDINDSGQYETSFTDPQRLLGAALESLSTGRVAILQESCNSLVKSVVIAIRYAVQRLQFSDDSGNELPIIEYQTHQWRLFPYVAASYIIKFCVDELSNIYIACVVKSRFGEMDMKQTSQMVSGVHALVCCSKALVTWTTQSAIQECREACGGHGYHKAVGLSDMRNNHDPRVTFEGDNNVLLQQTSNWLLRIFTDSDTDFTVFPNTCLSFMTHCDKVLAKHFSDDDVVIDEFIIHTYQWLICWLAKVTVEKMEHLKNMQYEKFKIRNLCQVFKARSLALVFAEYNIISHFQEKCLTDDLELKSVLNKLWRLYGLWSLHRHLSLLYQGGYSTSPNLSNFISETIIHLCQELKPEMLALVDSIAPPDFVLNSVLGYSDGKIYERLMDTFMGNNGSNISTTTMAFSCAKSKL